MNDIKQIIREMYCENFKDKIDENISYKDYFNSFTKKKIEGLIKAYSIFDNNKAFPELIILSVQKKNAALNYFIENIKKIYTSILKSLDNTLLKQLSIYVKNNKKNVIEIKLENLQYSLKFINFLNNNCIAKVKYLKKEKKLFIYTPIELKNVIKDILKDNTITRISKENSIINKRLYNLLSTYGVIPLKDLIKIYNKIYDKIDQQTMFNKIFIYRINMDDINIALYEDGYLIYNDSFENEDDAFSFFYSLPQSIDYKLYKKEEYEEIGDGIFHQSLKSFDELYNYLYDNLQMNQNDIIEFDDNFILDYMYSYQVDSELAKKNLNSKLNKNFKDMEFDDKIFLSRAILSLAKNYPNFVYKGYSYNEININKKH